MKYVAQDIKNEVAESFLVLFREKITKWLKNKVDDTFCIGDDQYQLVWNSGRSSYEVWLDDELLAWNDNIKDFLNIGKSIYAHSVIYSNVKSSLDLTDCKFTKSFQEWNCEQLREWNNSDYPND